MLFNIAFFVGLLLSPEALAIPSRLAAQVARRREGRRPQVYHGLDENTNAVSNTIYNAGWAGATWAANNGTFKTVTGTFTVPTPSNKNASASMVSASAWVGIDGYTCQTALFQTGIDLTVDNGQVSYDAWYEWVPAYADYFSGINISAGDVIRLTVTATSTTTGTATVENLTNGQTLSQSLNSTSALCQQNADWIVEDYLLSTGERIPLADFGAITFTDAVGTGTGTYTPSGATIAEIQQNNKTLTSVSISGSSVTIKYV